MNNDRIQWIDLAKGITMLLVVFGHFPDPKTTFEGEIINHILSTFTLPLFFIISGIFFKEYDSFCHFVVKKTDHLLIPYLVFFVIGVYFKHLNLGPAWFLFSLFIVSFLCYVLMAMKKLLQRSLKLKGYNLVCFGIVFIVSVILGLVAYNCHYEYNFLKAYIQQHIIYTESSFVSLPYYMVGYGLGKYTPFLKQSIGWSLKKSGIAIACILSTIVLCYIGHWGDTSLFRNLYDMSPEITYSTALLGSLGVMLLACQMNNIPLMTYLGRYSFIVLVTHYVIINCVEWLAYSVLDASHCVLTSLLLFIIIVVAELPTIWFCSHYLPYLFGQKGLIEETIKNSTIKSQVNRRNNR